MVWWMWAVLGLVFLIGEMLTPGGIFIIFFAAGALVVFLLELVGIHMPLWVQILVFGVLSVGSLLLFRKPILRRVEKGGPDHEVDATVGQEVQARGEFAVGASGTVEFRGSPWKAVNTGSDPIQDGDVCLVKKVDGLKLEIQKRVQE